jgi:hypothetical protein
MERINRALVRTGRGSLEPSDLVVHFEQTLAGEYEQAAHDLRLPQRRDPGIGRDWAAS